MSRSSDDSRNSPEHEKALREALSVIVPHGISVECRVIGNEDYTSLLAEERHSIPTTNLQRLKASGAARYIARGLLAEQDINEFPILRASAGEPIWPQNIVGSLAHDDEVAVAAMGSVQDFLGLGIDVEPATPLPIDIQSLVRTSADKTEDTSGTGLFDRVLFCAKEAVYKAVYPLDRVILNYDDISVDLTTQNATTTTGRRVQLASCMSPRIIVLAYIPRV